MDQITVKSIVERYQKPLFAFVLSLASCGREKAFQITVGTFALTLCPPGPPDDETDLRRALFRNAVEQCRSASAVAGPDLSAEGPVPPQKREETRLIKEALFPLDHRQKCSMLLRDQVHLPYEDIAAILGMSAKDVRSQTLAAREALRANVQQAIDGPEADR